MPHHSQSIASYFALTGSHGPVVGTSSSGTEIVLPSLSSTTRASQVVATLSASGMLTSIVETIIPCLHQNGLVFLDHAPDPPDVRRSQAATAFQQDGSQPEFGDASITFDMHMSGFIPVSHVEEEPVRASAEHGGHVWTSRHLREPLEFITWPYEWPFSMLKDAGLLQLRLLDTAVRNGWILKDATPFNIQWRQARPVFIDTPSFVPWDGGEFWQGYRQFCSMFLIPLMITAHLRIPFQPLLRSRLDGIPPEEAAKYFSGMRKFRRGVLSHIWFPAKAERRMRSSGRADRIARSGRCRGTASFRCALPAR